MATPPGVADSRLFSIRADKPGVTIDQASVNGQPLAVAGKSEGLTFFRIDDPVGVVSCRQQLMVVASTGERQVADIDLCAQNWQVSVHLTGSPVERPDPAGATPPATASPQPPDAAVITAALCHQCGPPGRPRLSSPAELATKGSQPALAHAPEEPHASSMMYGGGASPMGAFRLDERRRPFDRKGVRAHTLEC
jgi:hypothetical protein